MGHAYSSIVADFFARFKRISEHNVFFLMIRRPPRSTLSSSSAASDVYKRQVSDEAFYSENEIEDKDNVKVNKLSGSKVEWVEEESFFFKLSKWEKKLLEYYDKNPEFIRPESRRNEVISFVKGGLKDLSVSRKSITWGINVPSQKDHIIYVWLDALTNYLSALDYPNIDTDKYKNFWPASVHIIGKDILRFHAVYWPAFLLAANLPLPKTIYGHGWILSNEEKMSKSKGNILDPLEIIDKYGLDPLRFYLLKEVSFGNDGNISKAVSYTHLTLPTKRIV